jgi:hypothetical protein
MTQTLSEASESTFPGPTIEAFEALDVVPDEFDHEAHMYVAWSYLQRFDLLASIDRYRSVLRRLTQKLGVPGKYHETITWFYLIAVAERATGDAATDWTAFKNLNAELFARSPGIIQRFYSNTRLMSEEARQSFVLPDLSPPD